MGLTYLYLALSIAFEVVATTTLATTEGFTRPFRSAASMAMYFISYFFFGKAILVMNMGVAYAIWSGVGIIASALFGALLLKQPVTRKGLVGTAFILAGCLIVNLYGSIG